MAFQLLPGQHVEVTESGEAFALPRIAGRPVSILALAIPVATQTVTGFKLYGSLDGVTFAAATEDETFDADEVAGLKIETFPGYVVRMDWTSGVARAQIGLL